MPVYHFDNHTPLIAPDVWIAPGAQVLGRVQLAAQVGIWFNAVLRGDICSIHIGEKSNIQDNCTLHTDYDLPLTIEPFVSVGHQVVMHSCHVSEGSMIGMHATLLNNSHIGRNSIVAAGSLVTEGKTFPDGVLIMGSPAKIVRELNANEIAKMHRNTQSYVELAQRYQEQFKTYHV